MQYRASKRRCQITMERCKGATFLLHGIVMCQSHARDMYGDDAIDRLIRLRMVNWKTPKVDQVESFDWVNERDNK